MKRRAAAVVSLLAVCLVAAPALAAASALVAQARLSPVAIDFSPAIDAESFVLSVATPRGDVLRREFAAGQAITFSIADSRSQFPDGDYRWELTAAPRLRPTERAALNAARAAGDAHGLADAQRAAGIPVGGYVQSGSFRVADGAILDQSATEGRIRSNASPITHTQAADQVIPDDLIVQGSECVGLDCLNNESFGFDTIRLKENNTRIKFDDTSTSTGFPARDWQLTANDSASGGSSKFSIEDITGSKVPFTITAGAATNSIFADSTGRIGLRTSTPVLDLHINTSNTPAIRLEQNNSGGFTAQTWDVAGNEANFFVRDVTGGSTLPFRIRPGAPTSSLDISADGEVGVGTASPTHQLDVRCNQGAVACQRIQNSSATGFSGFSLFDEGGTESFFFGTDNAANFTRLNSVNSFPFVVLTNSVEHVRVETDGDVGINCNAPASDLVIASGGGCANPSSSLNAGATQFTAASSRTFKENLTPIEVPEILQKISGIDVYHYDFKNGPKDRIGLIAEDFHQVFGRGDEKYIDGGEVQLALWLAVQRLTAVNEQLVQRLNALEAKVAESQATP